MRCICHIITFPVRRTAEFACHACADWTEEGKGLAREVSIWDAQIIIGVRRLLLGIFYLRRQYVSPVRVGYWRKEDVPLQRAWRVVCRSRKRRVVSQFEDLQACYLKLRKQGPDSGSAVANGKMPNGHATGRAACPASHLEAAYLTRRGLFA